ncbi:MAG: hypothetical protein GTN81_11030 [Proteobacteria bacterium]|nr:hypothetical protein [Pseudomonadota bacterium]
MKKWLPLMLIVLYLLTPISLIRAEPFLTAQGPIMDTTKASSIIVVNEMRIFIDPTTPITDADGRILGFSHLKRGRWVSVEVEPDEASGYVATRVVLIKKK